MSQRMEKMIKNHQHEEEIKKKLKIEQSKLSQIQKMLLYISNLKINFVLSHSYSYIPYDLDA